ncbi:MAG: hypothetical protein LBL67_01465 [Coriobacteriales bacterium]|jgi:5'(3')-deoxyribonucleotidase|nr:hypothetical protein [Coriobacteriales bacterium]
MQKLKLMIDMDGVLTDWDALQVPPAYSKHKDRYPGVFRELSPYPGALDAVKRLQSSDKYELFILSTCPWQHPSGLADKQNWLKQYFGAGKDNPFYKRTFFTHCKNLIAGDILIDDRPHKNGAADFPGRLIYFGGPDFPDWPAVLAELL